MAAMDFMHKQLINAASKDALGSIGMGAGIGAGVGAASSLITGNDSLLGGATSGAMLGAAGGAGMRYAGTKYGAGMADIIGDGARKDTGKFATSTFSRPEAKPFNFWKNSDADDAAMAKVRANVVEPGSGKGPAAATGSASPEAGSVSTSANKLPNGTNLVERQARQADLQEAFKGQSNVDLKHQDAQSTWKAKLAAAKTPEAVEARRAAAAAKNNELVKNISGPVSPKVAPGSNVMSGNSPLAPVDMTPKKFNPNPPALNALSSGIKNSSQSQAVNFPLGSSYKSPLDISVPKVNNIPDFKSGPKPNLKLGVDGYYK